MKRSLPVLLSFNGGYVDTAGFLSLHGLFAAHVTGNFVTLGAALALGTSGILAKLLALPLFCAVVILARLYRYALLRLNLPVLRMMLGLKLLILIAAAVMAIRLGPFATGDGWPALLTGMTLVTAMAIQNAAHRVHLGDSPPTTMVTGTTTQVMIDLADLLHGLPAESATAMRARVLRMSASVVSFALGCAAAALLYSAVDVWCFAVPPLVAVVALVITEANPAPVAPHRA
ncbi:MAG: DUF1275 family protein [Azospirillaceae bacterium]|nr:DUF1275 family protein [Azospirillaceae bacterium]